MAYQTQADTPSYPPSVNVSVEAGVLLPCVGCGVRTRIRVGNRPGHYVCIGRLAVEQLDAEVSPEQVNAFRLLQESILASRKHPLLRVPKADRDNEPWTLITETMRGEHRYRIPALAGRVVVLDRRGSYPSAMGNVPVAASKLTHTGALDRYDRANAGIFLINRFEFDGPHPLGEIAEHPGRWWISTPHMRLLVQLTEQGRIRAPKIYDSWTGPAVTNLFRQYADEVGELRGRTQGTEVYADVKRKTSIAIRGLWPKGARSPFWRPDWSVAVRAEASVRHWIRAQQAVSDGATLLRLGAVDEVAFAGEVPPHPYTVGDKFGQVSIKATMSAAEWNRAAR